MFSEENAGEVCDWGLLSWSRELLLRKKKKSNPELLFFSRDTRPEIIIILVQRSNMEELWCTFCVFVHLNPVSRFFCFLFPFKQTQWKQLNRLNLNADKQGVNFRLC